MSAGQIERFDVVTDGLVAEGCNHPTWKAYHAMDAAINRERQRADHLALVLAGLRDRMLFVGGMSADAGQRLYELVGQAQAALDADEAVRSSQ